MSEVIYVNGCSFTYGEDISDYILDGYNHHDELSFNEVKNCFNDDSAIGKVSNYLNWRQSKYEEFVPDKPGLNFAGLVTRLRKQINWPSLLADITNTTIINKSAPGCDNYSIYLRTCNDIYNLKKQGIDVKKAIIQFTCRTRHAYIKEFRWNSYDIYRPDYLDNNKLDDEFFVRSLNQGSTVIDKYTAAEKLFLSTDNYQALELDIWLRSRLLNYLSKINMYKNAIQGALGIEVIMVDSLFFEIEHASTSEGNTSIESSLDIDNPDPETYLGRTILSLFPKGFDSMARMIDRDHKAFTPGFHFTKEVHEKFAQHLAKKYFNE
jgi:hypothetical protein